MTRFFFWTCVFFRYQRSQTTVALFARVDFPKNAFYCFLIRAEILRKNKKEIQSKRMGFSNRSRKNTRIQKKDCVNRTFQSKVTTVWKFSISKIEGSRGFGKVQTAITRASDVRFRRFFFWTRVFFRYVRKQITVRWFERADLSTNAFCSFFEL